jgi:Fe-S-cluster-containing hydrogenase component 2
MPQNMAVTIDSEKCTGCGACVDACPVDAIKLVDGKAVVDEETCIDCGTCVDECPVEAIEL